MLTYLAENKRESTVERERLQNLALKAKDIEDGRQDLTTTSESRRLDCIYDNEPWGLSKTHRMSCRKCKHKTDSMKLI